MTDDESTRREPPAPDGDDHTEPTASAEPTVPVEQTAPPEQAPPAQPTVPMEQTPPGWAPPTGPPAGPQTWPAPPAWGTSPASPPPGAPSAGGTTGDWAQAAPTQPMAADQPPTQPMAAAQPPAPPMATGQPPTQPAAGAVPPWGAPPPTEPPPWAGGAPVPVWGTAPPPRPPSNGRTAAIIAGVLIVVMVLGAGAILAIRALFAQVDDVVVANPPQPTAVPEEPDQPDPGPLPSEPVLPPRTLDTDEAREYVSRANQYCRNVTDPALKDAIPLYQTDPETFLRKAASANRDLTDFLQKDVPDEISAPVGEVVDDWETLSDNYERAADAIADGDLDAASRYLATGEAANAQGNAVATSIGMSDCAQAGGLGEGSEASPSITA